jgi:hypothetical protein
VPPLWDNFFLFKFTLHNKKEEIFQNWLTQMLLFQKLFLKQNYFKIQQKQINIIKNIGAQIFAVSFVILTNLFAL